MSRWDRLLIFAACNLGAAVCFIICFTLFLFLATKPRKFAILYVLVPFALPLFISRVCYTARGRLFSTLFSTGFPIFATGKLHGCTVHALRFLGCSAAVVDRRWNVGQVLSNCPSPAHNAVWLVGTDLAAAVIIATRGSCSDRCSRVRASLLTRFDPCYLRTLHIHRTSMLHSSCSRSPHNPCNKQSCKSARCLQPPITLRFPGDHRHSASIPLISQLLPWLLSSSICCLVLCSVPSCSYFPVSVRILFVH